MDDATRRLLRFSMFLQGFGLAMFAGALIVQLTTGTTSGLSIVFIVAVVILIAALIITGRQVRRH